MFFFYSFIIFFPTNTEQNRATIITLDLKWSAKVCFVLFECEFGLFSSLNGDEAFQVVVKKFSYSHYRDVDL